jgi:hypothetical protein
VNRFCSIFSQILQLFSRWEFESAVRKHKAERHARGFTCWGQFVAMLFCQLGRAQSLREICGGLAASEGKLKHLGLPSAPARTTLSYANQHRPWQLYQTVFQQLLEKCQQVVASAPGKKRRKFRFKNQLMSLDGTVIALCASVFDWGQFRRTKGAVKLHLLLDHDGHLPSFAVVTEGKQHEVQVARQLHFAPGTILAVDRGYTDYEWFARLKEEGVWFVTRLKDNADYGVVEERELPQRKGLLRDQVIFFYKLAEKGVNCFFRRIEYLDEENERVLVFLTNHLNLGGGHSGSRVQGPLGDRGVFSGPETKLTPEDIRGDLGERVADADLDGADCHVADQVPATARDLRLVAVEPGGPTTPAVVCVPGSVDLD